MKKPVYVVKLITLLCLISATVSAGPKESSRSSKTFVWAVQHASSLTIEGATNVNTFGCEVAGYFRRDTLSFSTCDNTKSVVPLNGELMIDVARFDCHSRMLTADLRKTLKVDAYPNLVIRFLCFERMPFLDGNNSDRLKGIVELELAGVCKKFQVYYNLQRNASGKITLNGERDFCFSDFNLVPPKKAGGIIKVKQDFHVDFKLLLDPVQ